MRSLNEEIFSNLPSRCAVRHKNAKFVKIGQEVENEQVKNGIRNIPKK